MTDTTLSHYKIIAELGRGGMGIVYKAEDTKLDRTVAIKVLPSATLASEDDRARFYREAKAAAQLHHPNIASVFEIDEAVPSDAPHGTQPSPFIAMEFIDGETLSSRIAKGPLKVEEAVRLAKEIASALEAAHEKNIVHRDIKSANVMVTAKGSAKVLDFGLAKTAQSTMLTRMGSTLGTFAYMSPEQARGEEVDRRTDIWALGVVLYEMVAGRHPFPGDYEQAVVYSILNESPEPLTAVRTGVPMELERIVGKLLAKDPSRRYQSTAGLNADLLGVDVSASAVTGNSRTPHSALTSSKGDPSYAPVSVASDVSRPGVSGWLTPVRSALAMVLVLLAGLAMGKWMLGRTSGNMVPPVVRRVSMKFDGLSRIEAPGISPDGKHLVFTAIDSTANPLVFVYDFASGDFSATYPNIGFRYSKFSPDGRWVAFSGIGAGISTMLLPDGQLQTVTTQGEWGVWESNESLLFRLNSNLFRIAASGGEPELVAEPDSSMGLNRLWPMDVLVDQGIALVAGAGIGEFDRQILTVDLETGAYESIIESAHMAIYLDSGHLVYLQGGGLVGQLVVRAFDADKMEPHGLPATLNIDPLNWLTWSVGKDGTVVYGSEAAIGDNIYTWTDPNGRIIGSLELPDGDFLVNTQFSPSGDRLAATRLEGNFAYGDIWIYDVLNGRAPIRLSDGGFVSSPTWSTDGETIYFGDSGQSGTTSTIQSVRSNGSEVPRILVELQNMDVEWVVALPDGESVLFHDGLSDDLYVLTLADTSISQITATPSLEERDPSVSPDGRFVATHDLEQPQSKIIVKEIDGAGQWEISDSRETFRRPVWSADSRNLYFVNPNGSLFRHRVALEPTFTPIGEPEEIGVFGGTMPEIAVHPDGQRLLVSSSALVVGEGQGLNFIFNFQEEARRIAPTK